MNYRKVLKKTVKAGFLVVMFPLCLLYHLLAVIAGKDRAFVEFSQLLALLPGIIGIYSRAAFFSYTCDRTSTDISVGFLTVLSHQDTHLGPGVYIGAQSNIGKSRIGPNCLIGSGVHILSGKNQHTFTDHDTPIRDQGGVYTKIDIGEDCWIGNNSVVMADLGRRCVVAAGSVVTRSVADYSVVAGNPARVVKTMKIEKPPVD